MIISILSDKKVKVLESFYTLIRNNNTIPCFLSNEGILTSEVWCSNNILTYIDKFDSSNITWHFRKILTELKLSVEYYHNARLEYKFVHFFDYGHFEGSAMDWHDHVNAEDYVFIIYLNDCTDGETIFDKNELVKLIPSKGLTVYFDSKVPHCAAYSKNKKILVGGLKIINGV